jgi:hypothetical protein
VPERYDFRDFKRVDGAMAPTKIAWSHADYQVIFEATEIRHNVPALDSRERKSRGNLCVVTQQRQVGADAFSAGA